LRHSSRLRDGCHCGRCSGGCTASRPETPSIITSRTSCSVSPTSAIRATGWHANGASPSAWQRTHSAPPRVLPAPRPPIISQLSHGLPFGASSGGRW
jgi:hypothetical protein